jgi:hypothetical protein
MKILNNLFLSYILYFQAKINVLSRTAVLKKDFDNLSLFSTSLLTISLTTQRSTTLKQHFQFTFYTIVLWFSI